MATLNFNFNIKGLDGNEIIDANAGKILGNYLVSQPKGDVIKLFEWSLKLYRGEPIDVDTSDQKLLKSFINESNLPVLTKHGMLEVFDNLT